MTYRVELIPKRSVMDDIIGAWKNSGRDDNVDKGQFVFEAVDCVNVSDGVIEINKDKDGEIQKAYYYNMADFYRVKVIENEY